MSDTRMAAAAPQENGSTKVVAVYQHPQGKKITVFADGSYECRGPDGKKKPTSATPDKLASGFGQWERVG